MRLAIIGATGLVGREMLTVLEEENIPITELLPIASSESVGKNYISFKNLSLPVISIDEGIEARPDFALFSAGSTISLAYAPKFAEKGITVVDNSSAWRMEPFVPLVVPEINAETIGSAKIIANPNCSTIQLVMVLSPLQKIWGIKRVVVSTYQAVTGTGKKAIDQLFGERNQTEHTKVYPYLIDLNCLPQCDVFLENDYTKEEMKLLNESRKILSLPDLRLTATAVRVPVIGGHSESVNIQLEKPFNISEIKEILNHTKGVVVMDDPKANVYPMPILAKGKNDVFVGRIRKDESIENGLNLWIVADNLRKGAATNAVQILKFCYTQKTTYQPL